MGERVPSAERTPSTTHHTQHHSPHSAHPAHTQAAQRRHQRQTGLGLPSLAPSSRQPAFSPNSGFHLLHSFLTSIIEHLRRERLDTRHSNRLDFYRVVNRSNADTSVTGLPTASQRARASPKTPTSARNTTRRYSPSSGRNPFTWCQTLTTDCLHLPRVRHDTGPSCPRPLPHSSHFPNPATLFAESSEAGQCRLRLLQLRRSLPTVTVTFTTHTTTSSINRSHNQIPLPTALRTRCFLLPPVSFIPLPPATTLTRRHTPRQMERV